MKVPVVAAAAGRGGTPARAPLVPVSHVSGGRDLWSDPLSRAPDDPESAVWDLLREVLDPELPISLVDLGLIYGVDVQDRTARVKVTFTATACPCMDFIREDIRDRLLLETWLEEVVVEDVWDPPWTSERISAKGREELRRLGVGV